MQPDELARSVLRLAMEGERDPVRLHDGTLEASFRRCRGTKRTDFQECEISMATLATAAAVNVPMSAARVNGIDLRNVLRIYYFWPASC